MKKAFIAVGLAVVAFLAFADWAHEEQKLKHEIQERIANSN